MRNAKYNGLVARHKELMDEIADEPRTLAAHHRFRVEETYYAVGHAPKFGKRQPGPRLIPRPRF